MAKGFAEIGDIKLKVEELTAQDRCDHPECPAAAMSIVTMPGGGFLLFCAHHSGKLHESLIEKGFSVEKTEV